MASIASTAASRSSNKSATSLRIAIESQRELRHVVGADGHAVKVLEVLFGQQGIRRQFRHHDDLQVILAALQTVFGQNIDNLFRLVHGTDERNHDLDVAEPHVVPHLSRRGTFHVETGPKTRIDITCCAPVSEHGVLFIGLVFFTADQVGIFVRFEVGHANNDGLGSKRRSDAGNTFSQFVDEKSGGLS